MSIDIERLKGDADMISVARYIGASVKKCGHTVFIDCPNPNHNESKPDHCAVSRDGKKAHCFSCGYSYDVLAYVSSWNEKFRGCSMTFKESLETVGDVCGGHECYETGYKHKSPMPFSDEDLRSVGFEQLKDLKKLWETDKDTFFKKLLDASEKAVKRYSSLKRMIANPLSDEEISLKNEWDEGEHISRRIRKYCLKACNAA